MYNCAYNLHGDYYLRIYYIARYERWVERDEISLEVAFDFPTLMQSPPIKIFTKVGTHFRLVLSVWVKERNMCFPSVTITSVIRPPHMIYQGSPSVQYRTGMLVRSRNNFGPWVRNTK